MSDYPRNGRGGGGNGGPDRHARNRGRGGGGGGPYHRDGPPAWRGGGGGGGGGGRNGFRGGRDDDGRIQYRGGGGGGQHMYRGPPTASGPFVPQGPAAAAAAAVAPVAPPQPKIDRTKTCPLLLRVYIQNDAHHSASSFAVRGEEPTEDSILIYTWPDASLRELAGLIQQVNAESRSSERELSFAFVYPDKTGTNVIKHVMTIASRAPAAAGAAEIRGRGGAAAQQALARQLAADQKQLQQLGFETGDSLSVALLKTTK